jgi:hypothetical protein
MRGKEPTGKGATMKTLMSLCAAAALVFAAAMAQAANSCSVSGDLAKDGNLTIDINWTIDTSKYPGASPDAIRGKVYDEIWKEVLPKLVKKSEGQSLSYDKSRFTKVSEEKSLVEERADGTKVMAYKAKVRFDGANGGAATAGKSEKDRQKDMDEQFHYRFVNEGRD